MAEEPGKKDDEFDLSPELEGYISLDEARVLALQHARDNREVYGPYAEVELVFEVVDASETEDFYEVTLSFRPIGRFAGSPGVEQFIISKTGTIEVRQLLEFPIPEESGTGGRAPSASAPTPPVVPPRPPVASGAGSVRTGGVSNWLLFGGLGAIVMAVIAIVITIAVDGNGGGTPGMVQVAKPDDTPAPTGTKAPSTPVPKTTLYPTFAYTPQPTPTDSPIIFTPEVKPTIAIKLRDFSLLNTPQPTPTPDNLRERLLKQLLAPYQLAPGYTPYPTPTSLWRPTPTPRPTPTTRPWPTPTPRPTPTFTPRPPTPTPIPNDDHGNTIGSATAFPPLDLVKRTKLIGILDYADDVDYFYFPVWGRGEEYSVWANFIGPYGNVNITPTIATIRLYDSYGRLTSKVPTSSGTMYVEVSAGYYGYTGKYELIVDHNKFSYQLKFLTPTPPP